MALIKCPRCELNYIQDTQDLCEICKKGIKGGDEAPEICIECGERPVMPGEELCRVCLRDALGKAASAVPVISEDGEEAELDEEEEVFIPEAVDVLVEELPIEDDVTEIIGDVIEVPLDEVVEEEEESQEDEIPLDERA